MYKQGFYIVQDYHRARYVLSKTVPPPSPGVPISDVLKYLVIRFVIMYLDAEV